jgi:NAD-dependent deacetylase
MRRASSREGDALEAARAILAGSKRVVILTGAGLSADSGLRTFRDAGGQWKQHRAEDLATPEAFERDPCLVWAWYDQRRRAVTAATPNAAHLAIAEFAARRDGVSIVTQNVDALHTLAAVHVAGRETDGAGDGAGTGRRRPAEPLELHGCLFRSRCTACGRRREDRDPVDASSLETLPRCRDCSGLLRPDVVWFGESLGEPIERAFELAARAQACLVVGTSAVVHPAASVALMTHRAGGVIVEVNPAETPLTPLSEISLRGTAAQAVPALLCAS